MLGYVFIQISANYFEIFICYVIIYNHVRIRMKLFALRISSGFVS